jgi:hypothetical protein
MQLSLQHLLGKCHPRCRTIGEYTSSQCHGHPRAGG